MPVGNIIKLTEQFNIHKAGTLGVLVNSEHCAESRNEDSVSVIFEDGHFITVTENDPIQNIGYNADFNMPCEQFKTLLKRVKSKGKSAFVNGVKCSEITVVLTDDADRKNSFAVGFNQAGEYYQTESDFEGEEEGTHTVNAFIGVINIDIDGNGWRDLEAGDYMEDFISDVIFGERDASEFLVNISEALGVSGEAGMVF